MSYESPMEKIVKVRKYRDYSQGQIAELLGIAKASWSRKEQGSIKGFSFDDIEKILQYLKVDARWVFNQRDCSLEDALQENFPQKNYKHYSSDQFEGLSVAEMKQQYQSFEDRLEAAEQERESVLKEVKQFMNDFNKKVKILDDRLEFKD